MIPAWLCDIRGPILNNVNMLKRMERTLFVEEVQLKKNQLKSPHVKRTILCGDGDEHISFLRKRAARTPEELVNSKDFVRICNEFGCDEEFLEFARMMANHDGLTELPKCIKLGSIDNRNYERS